MTSQQHYNIYADYISWNSLCSVYIPCYMDFFCSQIYHSHRTYIHLLQWSSRKTSVWQRALPSKPLHWHVSWQGWSCNTGQDHRNVCEQFVSRQGAVQHSRIRDGGRHQRCWQGYPLGCEHKHAVLLAGSRPSRKRWSQFTRNSICHTKKLGWRENCARCAWIFQCCTKIHLREEGCTNTLYFSSGHYNDGL